MVQKFCIMQSNTISLNPDKELDQNKKMLVNLLARILFNNIKKELKNEAVSPSK